MSHLVAATCFGGLSSGARVKACPSRILKEVFSTHFRKLVLQFLTVVVS